MLHHKYGGIFVLKRRNNPCLCPKLYRFITHKVTVVSWPCYHFTLRKCVLLQCCCEMSDPIFILFLCFLHSIMKWPKMTASTSGCVNYIDSFTFYWIYNSVWVWKMGVDIRRLSHDRWLLAFQALLWNSSCEKFHLFWPSKLSTSCVTKTLCRRSVGTSNPS